MEGVFGGCIVAQDEAQQIKQNGRCIGMAAPLHLEVAEAHVVEFLDFRGVERQYAVFRVGEQGVQIAAPVGVLLFIEIRAIVAQEIERGFRKGFVVGIGGCNTR